MALVSQRPRRGGARARRRHPARPAVSRLPRSTSQTASGEPAAAGAFLRLLIDPASVDRDRRRFAAPRGLAVGSRCDCRSATGAAPFVVRGAAPQRGPAQGARRQFRADGHRRRAVGLRSARPGRSRRRAAGESGRARRSRARHRRAAARRAGRAAAGAARRAGRADAGGVSVQPDGARRTSRCSSGCFSSTTPSSTSVIARREEIGMLRALGVARRQVLALFLGEAAALGAPAARWASPLGWVLADGAGGADLDDRHDAVRRDGGARPRRSAGGRSRWPSRSACRWRCSPRCVAGAGSGAASRRSRRCAAPIAIEHGAVATAPATCAGAVVLLALAACWPRSGRSTGLPSSGSPSALAVVFGAVVARAGVLSGCRALTARPAAPAARRRGLAGHDQSRRRGAAPVDLGRRAGREPVDDGRHRGDDRQLPRDGRSTGSARRCRPICSSPRRRRSSLDAQATISPALEPARRRAIPTSRPSIGSARLDVPYRDRLIRRRRRRLRRAARRTARSVQGAGDGARGACATRSASDAVVVSESLYAQVRRHAVGDSVDAADPAGPRRFRRRRGVLRLLERSRRRDDGPRAPSPATSATRGRPA